MASRCRVAQVQDCRRDLFKSSCCKQKSFRAKGIDSLPNETLLEIFNLGRCTDVPREFLKFRLGGTPVSDVPFVILASHVCRRWRATAVGNPTLWTRIDFGYSLPLCRMHVERSRNCGLDVEITHSYPMQFSPKFKSEVLDFMIPTACRWRKLVVRSPTIYLFRLMSQLIGPLLLSRLEHIAVVHPYNTGYLPDRCTNNSTEPQLPQLIFPGRAPNLKAIVLDGFSILGCWPPLSGVTELSLFPYDPHRPLSSMQLMRLLLECRFLSTLTLRGAVADFSDGELLPLQLLSLLSLTLDFSNVRNADPTSTFCAAVSAPNLRSFCIRDTGFDGTISNFVNFIQRRQLSPLYPILEHLSISDVSRLASNTVVDRTFMSAFPAITKLSMYRALPVELAILKLLASDTDPPHLWRSLQTLEVNAANEELLMKALARRREIGLPVRRVVVLRDEQGAGDARKALKRLAAFQAADPLFRWSSRMVEPIQPVKSVHISGINGINFRLEFPRLPQSRSSC